MSIRGGNLYVGEDALVEWGDPENPGSGLYDRNTGSFVNDATVTFQLYAADGSTAITNGSGTCAYVSGTLGCYRGVLEDNASITSGTEYVLEVLATASSDRIGRRRIPYTAKYHGSD